MIARMNRHRLTPLAASVLAALSLTACTASGSGGDETTSPAPVASSPTVQSSPTATEQAEPTPEPVADAPPAACDAQTSATGPSAYSAAVDEAGLDPTISTAIGVQAIHSVDDPELDEVVVRICSEPLTEEELVSASTAIARAIYATPEADSLALLKISAWIPDGEGSVEQDRTATADYDVTLWDEADDAVLATAWDILEVP